MSPLEKAALPAPPSLRTTATLLQGLFHEWRCLVYREACSETMQVVLREKHFASQVSVATLADAQLFKGRKVSYPASVAQAFLGDQLALRVRRALAIADARTRRSGDTSP
jgi:hypothetical protein